MVTLAVTIPILTSSPIIAEQEEQPKPQLAPELIQVCTCESGQGTGKPQQFNVTTGDVLRGNANPDDIGMCQININPNITDWQRIATEHGWDVFTEDGNILMANWILENSGIQNWNWSKHCWQ